MKKLFTLIIFSTYGFAFSQVKPLESFVPKGCKILATAKGDLNNDKQEDVVLILREPDMPYDPKKAEQYDEDSIVLHPQAIVVLLKKGKGYEQKVYNKVFIPTKNKKDYADEEDYFVTNPQNFYIKNGVLHCTFNYYSNLSLWSDNEETYSFYLKGNDIVLTQYRCFMIHGSDGATLEKIINFDKGTVTLHEKVTDYETGTVKDTQPPVVSKIGIKKPALLKNMVNALHDDFDIDYEGK